MSTFTVGGDVYEETAITGCIVLYFACIFLDVCLNLFEMFMRRRIRAV